MCFSNLDLGILPALPLLLHPSVSSRTVMISVPALLGLMVEKLLIHGLYVSRAILHPCSSDIHYLSLKYFLCLVRTFSCAVHGQTLVFSSHTVFPQLVILELCFTGSLSEKV